MAKKITTFERAVLKRVWAQRLLKFLKLRHWDTNDDSVTWNGKPTTELNEDEMMDELIKEYGLRK